MMLFTSLTEDANMIRKWIKCEGNGKLSELWNEFGGKISFYFLWIIPMFICVVATFILIGRCSTGNHEKIEKRDEIDAVTWCSIYAIYFSTRKNLIFETHCFIFRFIFV